MDENLGLRLTHRSEPKLEVTGAWARTNNRLRDSTQKGASRGKYAGTITIWGGGTYSGNDVISRLQNAKMPLERMS